MGLSIKKLLEVYFQKPDLQDALDSIHEPVSGNNTELIRRIMKEWESHGRNKYDLLVFLERPVIASICDAYNLDSRGSKDVLIKRIKKKGLLDDDSSTPSSLVDDRLLANKKIFEKMGITKTETPRPRSPEFSRPLNSSDSSSSPPRKNLSKNNDSPHKRKLNWTKTHTILTGIGILVSIIFYVIGSNASMDIHLENSSNMVQKNMSMSNSIGGINVIGNHNVVTTQINPSVNNDLTSLQQQTAQSDYDNTGPFYLKLENCGTYDSTDSSGTRHILTFTPLIYNKNNEATSIQFLSYLHFQFYGISKNSTDIPLFYNATDMRVIDSSKQELWHLDLTQPFDYAKGNGTTKIKIDLVEFTFAPYFEPTDHLLANYPAYNTSNIILTEFDMDKDGNWYEIQGDNFICDQNSPPLYPK